MALNLPNFLGAPIQRNDFEINQPVNPFAGLENIVSDVYGAYHKPMEMKNKREQERQIIENKKLDAEAKRIANLYRDQREKAEIDYLKNHALTEAMGPALAQSNIGLHNAQAKYYEDGGRSGNSVASGGKKYAPSYIAKLMLERQEAAEGFLPGSNRTVELSPDQKEEYINRIDLSLQKQTTDTDTRKRSLFANNLVQSIDNANIDDLTRYSGPKGALKLKSEQGKDLFGKASEDYIKHKEAQKAVALEAQELRQFLGTSITPDMDKALRQMVDASSIATDPTTAKRMIEKSRSIIKKQLGTYQKALKSTSPYTGAKSEDQMGVQQANNEAVKEAARAAFGEPPTSFIGDISAGVQDMVQIRNNRTGQIQIVPREEAERLRRGQ